jgi:hypothetical protein
MSNLTVEEQTQLTMRVLDAGLRNDEDAVNELMNQLGREGGWQAVATATLAFATALYAAEPLPDEGVVGLVAHRIETGEHVPIEQTGLPPDAIATARILAAIGNNDRRAALDVFRIAVEGDYGHDTVSAVLSMVVAQLLTIEEFRERYGRYWS